VPYPIIQTDLNSCIIGTQEGCDICQGLSVKNAVIAISYSFLIHEIEIGKSTATNLNAAKPARPPVRGDGSKNQTTAITSVGRRMCNGFNAGETTTLATGSENRKSPPMRYKIS